MQRRVYQSPGIQPDVLVDLLANWFIEHNYEAQKLVPSPGCLVVQGSQDDPWRSALGVAAALTIEVNTLSPDQIEVKVGAGAWYDKLTMASLGFLFFLPLVLIAAAWGTWQQAQLDKKIWEVIESGLPTATEQLLPWNASPLPDPELPTDWFNPETGEIYSMRFFMRMTSWQQAMADGVIDPVEIAQQSSLVLELLQTLETGLSDEVHNHLGEVFGELIALQAMQSAALVRKLTP